MAGVLKNRLCYPQATLRLNQISALVAYCWKTSLTTSLVLLGEHKMQVLLDEHKIQVSANPRGENRLVLRGE